MVRQQRKKGSKKAKGKSTGRFSYEEPIKKRPEPTNELSKKIITNRIEKISFAQSDIFEGKKDSKKKKKK